MSNAQGGPDIAETTREDVERAIWELTAFHGDAVAVDALLLVIDAYAMSMAEQIAGVPPRQRSSVYHMLMTYAGELIDTGAKMRLVSPARAELDDAVQAVAEAGVVPYQRHTNLDLSLPEGQLRCRICREIKDDDQFARDSKAATGHKGACKTCEAVQRKARKQLVSAGG